MAADDLSSCGFIEEDFNPSCGCLLCHNRYRLPALRWLCNDLIIIYHVLFRTVSNYFTNKTLEKCVPTNLKFIEPCIVIYFYSETNQIQQCLKFILFWNNPISFPLASRQQCLFNICVLPYVQS